MSDPNLDNAVAFLFSSLFHTIEELALKNRACHDVLAARVPNYQAEMQTAERNARQSDLAARNTQLRLQAIAAVRDRNFDELIGLAGQIAGTTLPYGKGGVA